MCRYPPLSRARMKGGFGEYLGAIHTSEYLVRLIDLIIPGVLYISPVTLDCIPPLSVDEFKKFGGEMVTFEYGSPPGCYYGHFIISRRFAAGWISSPHSSRYVGVRRAVLRFCAGKCARSRLMAVF